MSSGGELFKRPSGTRFRLYAPYPALKTPGYFQTSLRDTFG